MGPSVSVLLREPLSPREIGGLDQWLRTVANTVEGTLGHWDVWITGDALDCPDHSGRAPCTLLVNLKGPDPAYEWEYLLDDERVAVEAYLGFRPRQGIAIAAMCNKP